MTEEMKMTLTSKDYHNKAIIANRKIYSRFFNEIEERAKQGYFEIILKDNIFYDSAVKERIVKTLEAYKFSISEMYENEIIVTW